MGPNLTAVGVVVEDMARALAFYRQLGLDIPAKADSDPYAEVTLPGGTRLMFDTVDAVRGYDASWAPPSGSPRMSLAFACSSPAAVDETYRTLVAAGYDGQLEPWDAVWGMRYAAVLDPDGNGVALFCPNPA